MSTDLSSRGAGDNLVALARELPLYEPIHERRHCSEDDKLRARVLLDTPDLIRPIPVVEADGRFYAVDSSALIAAARDLYPEMTLPVRIVPEQEAWAIRHEHHRKQFAKEPMALARRALLMTGAGLQQKQVGEIIGVKEARVSQLIYAAKWEATFAEIKTVIAEPERISSAFWESVAATVKALAEYDRAKPNPDGLTRLEQFKARMNALLAAKQLRSFEEVRDELNLVNLRKPKTRRARTIGEPQAIPGTDQKLFVAAARRGGTVLNLPQNLDQALVESVISSVMEVLAAGSQSKSSGRQIHSKTSSPACCLSSLARTV